MPHKRQRGSEQPWTRCEAGYITHSHAEGRSRGEPHDLQRKRGDFTVVPYAAPRVPSIAMSNRWCPDMGLPPGFLVPPIYMHRCCTRLARQQRNWVPLTPIPLEQGTVRHPRTHCTCPLSLE